MAGRSWGIKEPEVTQRRRDRPRPVALPKPKPKSLQTLPESQEALEVPSRLLPLFVYGTLLDETFLGHLLEKPVSSVPAHLLDFELLWLQGFPYPTVFAAPGEQVEGRLYRNLTWEDYRRLDAYEGVGEGLYQRIAVEVQVEEGAAPESAYVYHVTEKTLRRYGML